MRHSDACGGKLRTFLSLSYCDSTIAYLLKAIALRGDKVLFGSN
ncbi:MAG: hypothetical protein ACYT04_50585 [Nostoc sp.]